MKQRVISASVLIVITLTCMLISEYTRVLFFGVVGILCSYEYSRALEKNNVYCAAWVMYTYIAVQAVLTVFHVGKTAYIVCMAAGIYLALFSGIIHPKVRGSGALYTLGGLAYPGFISGLLMMISVSSRWAETLILGCLSAAVCDAFALFGGMCFGKHRIAPDISPKKTIEGAVCGAIAAALSGAVIYLIPAFCMDLPLWLCIVTCFVSTTMGQMGDLAESMLKRMIGLKDFSNLIPGHGGMFDRMDSIMLSIPTAYLCLFIAGYAM